MVISWVGGMRDGKARGGHGKPSIRARWLLVAITPTCIGLVCGDDGSNGSWS